MKFKVDDLVLIQGELYCAVTDTDAQNWAKFVPIEALVPKPVELYCGRLMHILREDIQNVPINGEKIWILLRLEYAVIAYWDKIAEGWRDVRGGHFYPANTPSGWAEPHPEELK